MSSHSATDPLDTGHVSTQRNATSWDDYRYVRAVADTRSLAGAAERLGVNHSTVFRRINALEESLGTRIFERGRGGYALTAAGEEMVALAARIGEDITGFERRVAGRAVKPSGELRVTTNDTMAVHLLGPIFTSFLTAYPEIRLDIVVSSAALNLSKRDADIAIRATPTPSDYLIGRRVCEVAWAIYGTKRLAGRSEAAIAEEHWIGPGDTLANVPTARWMEREIETERVILRSNTILGMADIVASGAGIGLLPCFIGDRHSGIARLAPPVPELGIGLWLLTHPDLKQSARVRAFLDHAWDALIRQRALLEGRLGA